MRFLRPRFPTPSSTPTISGVDGGASPISMATAGVIIGDLCVYAMTTRDSIPDVLGPEGGGWTEIYRTAMSTNDIATVWYKIAGGSEPATWDWTHSAGSLVASAMAVWRGPTTLLEFATNTLLPGRGMPGAGISYPGALWLGFFHLALTSGAPTLTYPTAVVTGETNSCICNVYSMPMFHGRPAPNRMFITDTTLAVADAGMAVFA